MPTNFKFDIQQKHTMDEVSFKVSLSDRKIDLGSIAVNQRLSAIQVEAIDHEYNQMVHRRIEDKL